MSDDYGAAAYRLAQARQEGYFPIACRTGISFDRGSAAAGQNAKGRSRHILPYGAIDIIPVYAGWKTIPIEKAITWPAGVHVGIEQPWGAQNSHSSAGNGADVIRRLFASGAVPSPELSIPTDGLLYSEPVSLSREPGSAIGLRFYTPNSAVSDGTGFAVSRTVKAGQDYSYLLTAADDQAWGGTFPTGASPTAAFVQPLVILGRAADRRRHPSVAIAADSNGYGATSLANGNGSFDPGDAVGNSGWIERSLQNQIAFASFATPGDRIGYWNGVGGNGYRRLNALRKLGFSHIINGFGGTNDALGGGLTLAQLIDAWINLNAQLVGSGAEVWAATSFPYTTSTDGWTTLGGQTVPAAGVVIQQFSAWLRQNWQVYGCKRLIDLNLLVDPPLIGKWRTDLFAAIGSAPTGDGVHPLQLFLEWVAAQGLIAPEMFGV